MVATIATEEKLKIPVFDAAYTDIKGQNVGKIFNNPEILRHSIMQAMFDPEELKSLTMSNLTNPIQILANYAPAFTTQKMASSCLTNLTSTRRVI